MFVIASVKFCALKEGVKSKNFLLWPFQELIIAYQKGRFYYFDNDFFFQPNLCNSIDKNKLKKICKEVNSFSFFFLFLLSLLYLKFIIVFFSLSSDREFFVFFFFRSRRNTFDSQIDFISIYFIYGNWSYHPVKYDFSEEMNRWIIKILKYYSCNDIKYGN